MPIAREQIKHVIQMKQHTESMQKALVTIQRFGELTYSELVCKIGVDIDQIYDITNYLISVGAIEKCTNYRVRFIYKEPLHHAISILCPICGVNITDDNASIGTDTKGNPLCSTCLKTHGDKCLRVNIRVERKCIRCGKIRMVSLYSKCLYCCECARDDVHEGNIGKKRTDETRAKMSDTRTGTHPTKESIAKGAANRSGEKNYNYGKKLSAETRTKISLALTGKSRSQESIDKTANAQRGIPRPSTQGEKHPNWNGGTSFEPYCPKFNNRFRESIRDKFDRKCFMCGKIEEENGVRLSVHHVSYDKNCMCDGVQCEFVPLCKNCHARTHVDRDLWERFLLNALAYEGW